MISNWQHKFANILMVSSLLLLLLFIGFWLKSSYDKEFDNIKQASSFVFFDAINEVQDKAIQKMILAPKNKLNLSNVERETRIEMTIEDDANDNHKTYVVMDERNKTDTVKTFFINSKSSEEKASGKSGMLGMILGLTNEDDFKLDSLDKGILDKKIIRLITEQMDSNQMDISYQINVSSSSDSLKVTSSSNTYTDLTSGAQLSMEIGDYKQAVFKRLIPQILFSILLFGITSLAFFFIHKNLQAQKRLTALKNDFISNITHELKTPITTVGVAIEALSNFDALQNPARTQEYLDISKQELNRLSILVDKVLKMSMFDEKEPVLKLEQLDLQDLIENVLNSLKLVFEKNQANVSFKKSTDQILIEGDKIHLTNVIYNLIDNALKYSPSNPEINLKIDTTEKAITLSVSDKGMGIPKEYQAKIFDKFVRVPTGNEHNIKGYGLGLSYVANIIKQHKGTIQVDSDKGIGTTFSFSLPTI